jgi:hypothetical protein
MLMKREISRHFLKKYPNLECLENPSSRSRGFPTEGRTDRQTDIMKIVVTFPNFANTPKIFSALLTVMDFDCYFAVTLINTRNL